MYFQGNVYTDVKGWVLFKISKKLRINMLFEILNISFQNKMRISYIKSTAFLQLAKDVSFSGKDFQHVILSATDFSAHYFLCSDYLARYFPWKRLFSTLFSLTQIIQHIT